MNPFKSNLKTLVLIDGVHLSTLAKRHQMHIEFKTLRTLLSGAPLLGSPRYYASMQVMPQGESRGAGVQGLIDWLSYNGYKVTQQNVYPVQPLPANQRDIRWSPNTIATVMMLEAWGAYFEPGYDRLLLIAGNRELVPLCNVLRERNVQVDILSSIEYDMIDNDMRRASDNFYEFTTIAETIWRDRPSELNEST